MEQWPGDVQRKISHRLGAANEQGQKRYHAAEQKRNTYSQRHRRSPSTQTRRLQQDAKTCRDKLERRRQAQLPSDYKKHQLVTAAAAVTAFPMEKVPRRGCAVLYAEITSTIACNSVSFLLLFCFFVLFCFGSFFGGGGGGGGGRWSGGGC